MNVLGCGVINKSPNALIRNPANQFPRARLRGISWVWPALLDAADVELIGKPAPPLSPRPNFPVVPVGNARVCEYGGIVRITEDGKIRVLESVYDG